MKTRIVLLIMMVLLAACGKGDISSTGNQTTGNQGVLLRINIKPGDQWTLVQNQTMSQNIEMMGEFQTIVMTNTNSMANTAIEPADDGNARYTSLFQSMVMTQTINGETNVMDFSDPQGPLGKQMIVGTILTTTVAPSGEIKEVMGFDQLFGVNDNQSMQTMGQHFKDIFTKNPSITAYPEQAVNVGDTWTQSIDMPIMAMQTSIVMTYTVEQINSETVEVSLIGKGALIANEETLKEMAGASSAQLEDMDMMMDIAITIDGTMSIETATGLVSKQHHNQTMKGKMSMGKIGEEAMEIPMDMVQVIDVVLHR